MRREHQRGRERRSGERERALDLRITFLRAGASETRRGGANTAEIKEQVWSSRVRFICIAVDRSYGLRGLKGPHVYEAGLTLARV